MFKAFISLTKKLKIIILSNDKEAVYLVINGTALV
jgi:hypothetical protein